MTHILDPHKCQLRHALDINMRIRLARALDWTLV
jgi:hypothetical protein